MLNNCSSSNFSYEQWWEEECWKKTECFLFYQHHCAIEMLVFNDASLVRHISPNLCSWLISFIFFFFLSGEFGNGVHLVVSSLKLWGTFKQTVHLQSKGEKQQQKKKPSKQFAQRVHLHSISSRCSNLTAVVTSLFVLFWSVLCGNCNS